MEGHALVLGVADGNIGEAIVTELSSRAHFGNKVHGMLVTDRIDIPTSTDMYSAGYTHLIISLGMAKIAPLQNLTPDDIESIIDANLCTPLFAIRTYLQAVAPMPPGSEAVVIVVGSYGQDHVLSNSAPYCAAKAGINHAVKCLAWDYTSDNIRFHCINPHSVEDTPMTRNVLEQMQRTKHYTEAEAMAYWQRTLQLPKRLTRREVAKTVAWLIHAPTPHLAGTSIELYGGER